MKNSTSNFIIFYLQLGCPTTNFGLFSRGQPLSPDVNNWVCQAQQEPHSEPLVVFGCDTYLFLSQDFNPLGHSPQI